MYILIQKYIGEKIYIVSSILIAMFIYLWICMQSLDRVNYILLGIILKLLRIILKFFYLKNR